MNIDVKTLIVYKSDLNTSSQNKNIKDIWYEDLKDTNTKFYLNDIVLFLDENLQTKILKNRYGDNGSGLYNVMIKEIRDKFDKKINDIKRELSQDLEEIIDKLNIQ
jgi:hypothetical protein